MKKMDVRTLVGTAMLAAIAGVLMSFEFPLPLMPPFYKVDLSDVPSVVGLFAFGPVSGVAIEIIKILIKLSVKGTSTGYVGELANLIGAALFVYPIWGIYKGMKGSVKGMRISLIASVPIRIAFSCCINAFITLPLYAKAMGVDLNQVVLMVAKMNPAIKDLTTFIILATIPFNLIKNTVNNLAGYFLIRNLTKNRIIRLVSTEEEESDTEKEALHKELHIEGEGIN